MDTMDFDSVDLNPKELIDSTNLKAKIYVACGQKGKALLTWKSIIEHELGIDSVYVVCDSIFESIIGLATIYAESGQTKKARETISQFTFEEIKYILEILGAEYYILRGKISLSESRPKHAIRMFKNALKIKENKNIREKLEMLEFGIY
jgi:tetratricopeptide (TPR) repeat protein